MYLCKKRFNKLVILSFSEKPTYDSLLDYWDGEGYRVLPYEEAKPYLLKVTFENSPLKIEL